jgi:hypothetical protein
MPAFTSEANVRTTFQLTDTVGAPSSLLTAAIDDAHVEILRRLDPGVDTQTPEKGLVMGETLLSGAHVFRSLAAKDAFGQRTTTIGGQRVEAGQRMDALMAAARLAEESAWYMLGPYLAALPVSSHSAVTDTEPVLG